MKTVKLYKTLLFIVLGILFVGSLVGVIFAVTNFFEKEPTLLIIYNIVAIIIVLLSIAYFVFYAAEKTLLNELITENTYSLGRSSDFFNFHALGIYVRRARMLRFRKSGAYVVAFSACSNSQKSSTGRNSVISKLNGEISLYFENYFKNQPVKVRKANIYCYYHGHFVLYSFMNESFIEKFTENLSRDLFKIAEENDIHVFVQPYFGIAKVDDPKESIITSVENALTARNFSEKHFQEKTYYDEKLVRTVTDEDIKEILQAMEDKEFVVYYQPKFSLKTNEVVGSEALIRWNSSKYGFSGPGRFLSKAEEGGLMHDIDMYVFKAVCEDLAETKRKGRRLLPVSVNFSLYEFYAPSFLTSLTDILKSYDLDPSLIEIEITESTSQANSFLAVSYLKKIKEQGLKILMDDFGIGYSNINNLNKLPFDKVKIDKSLIDNIVTDVKTRESVRYLIALCQINGFESIAEGVDNAKQVEVLRRLKCDTIQGYYYSRPISKEAYDNFLQDNQFEKKKKDNKGGSK